MAEIAVALFGPCASLDHRAGPVSALVEIDGGTASYLIDPERNRIRLEAIPAPDLDKWISGTGLLLIARRKWWGASLRFDAIPFPAEGWGPSHAADSTKCRRPYLPRDLVSCLDCGRVIIAGRTRQGSSRPVTPGRRLASRAVHVLASAGVIARCEGIGDKAGRAHSLDCYGLPFRRA